MIVLSVTRTTTKYTIQIDSCSVLPTQLFLYRKDIDNEDIFEHVCTVDEIEKYPTYVPNPILFRKDIVEIEGASITELEANLQDKFTLLRQLDDDYAKFLELNKVGTTEQVCL